MYISEELFFIICIIGIIFTMFTCILSIFCTVYSVQKKK